MWLNQQLQQMGAAWRAQVINGEYAFLTAWTDEILTGEEYKGYAYSERTISNPSQKRPSTKPHGIALISCCGIRWDITSNNPAMENRSCPRDIIRTYDNWDLDHFPHTVGPVAVYVLVAGTDHAPLSLLLEAQNGEVLVARHNLAADWGVVGTWEWPVHIDEFIFHRPGIYHWKLYYGDDVLLDRPIVVNHKVVETNA
jgi:hypothetical protein